jgi:hypothetical protein
VATAVSTALRPMRRQRYARGGRCGGKQVRGTHHTCSEVMLAAMGVLPGPIRRALALRSERHLPRHPGPLRRSTSLGGIEGMSQKRGPEMPRKRQENPTSHWGDYGPGESAMADGRPGYAEPAPVACADRACACFGPQALSSAGLVDEDSARKYLAPRAVLNACGGDLRAGHSTACRNI